ncbi:hypothetical protein F511_18470 [Dorcoceras hygrometricum]|uniref:Uncharacterized protein n=1 Tax=Dorcoceras hygrometricum TaxID=472368 RepID=A0A2Z7CHV2_9LAMI|nr:hypothetical protein F511_18470 [Dorcoceras hygrometricum]
MVQKVPRRISPKHNPREVVSSPDLLSKEICIPTIFCTYVGTSSSGGIPEVVVKPRAEPAPTADYLHSMKTSEPKAQQVNLEQQNHAIELILILELKAEYII